jgi:hypothetical protein
MLEPVEVYPEVIFQRAVSSLCKEVLFNAGTPFQIVEGFGLDIAVFSESAVRFLEVKAFGGQRVGGVGFGDRHGYGTQMHLLLCDDGVLPLFDKSIRWIYADGTKSPGTARYALFTCAKAKNSAMNSVCRGKQNNLRLAELRDCLVPWPRLCDDIGSFLSA